MALLWTAELSTGTKSKAELPPNGLEVAQLIGSYRRDFSPYVVAKRTGQKFLLPLWELESSLIRNQRYWKQVIYRNVIVKL